MSGIRFSTDNRKTKAPLKDSKAMTLIVRQFDDGNDLIIHNSYDHFREYDIAVKGAELYPAYSKQKSEDFIEYDILSRDLGNDYDNLASKDLNFQNEGYVEPFQDSIILVTQPKVPSFAQSVPLEPPNSMSQPITSDQESAIIQKSTFRNEEKVVDDEEFMADLKSILGGQKAYDPILKKMVNKEEIVERGAEVPQRTEPPMRNEKELKPLGQKNEHEIFDRIAQSMVYANAYDLGSISLEKRFDDFDRLIELEEKKKQSKKAANLGPKGTEVNNLPKLPSTFSSQDFIEDLNYITQNGTSTAQSSTASLSESEIKGHAVEMEALKEKDSFSKEDTASKQEISPLE